MEWPPSGAPRIQRKHHLAGREPMRPVRSVDQQRRPWPVALEAWPHPALLVDDDAALQRHAPQATRQQRGLDRGSVTHEGAGPEPR